MHKIFISHSWAYSDEYSSLKQLLDSDPSFSYLDYSIPKDDPIHFATDDFQLREAIANKMQYVDVVIILAGVYANYSKWINNEITLAKRRFAFPKPIIAVEQWGSERTSAVVKEAADKIVGWRASSIIGAIREVNGLQRIYR